MSVDSIQSKNSETIASKAKGLAQQVLNLVNQALFDGLQEGIDFSTIMKEQIKPDVAKSENKQVPQSVAVGKPEKEIEADIVVKTKSEKAPKTHEKCNFTEEDTDLETSDLEDLVQVEEITEPMTEEAAQVELVPETSEQAVLEQAVPVQAESVQVDAVQSEAVAAAIISQVQPVKTEASEQTEVEDLIVAEAVAESTAQTSQAETQEKAIKSADLAIKESVQKDVKHQSEHISRSFKQAEEAAQVSADLNANTQAEIKPDTGIIVRSVSSDKQSLEANLQQFVAKTAMPEALLTGSIMTERLSGINPEHISSSRNLSLKINTAETGITIGSKAIAGSSSGNSAHLSFAGQNSQEAGQKLDSGKNSKPLTKGQSISVLEKVEAVMKKISEAKDGSMISLRLDPPQLGTVKADVSFRDGVLHARLTAENPQVLQLLRERASELQLTLRKMGLEVEKVSVSVSSEDYGTFSGDAGDRQGRNETGQGSFFSAQADFAELNDSKILDHWIA